MTAPLRTPQGCPVSGAPRDPELHNTMSHYDSLIDGTDFRTVVQYLNHPQSPIRTLLHVRNEKDIAKVAEVLEADGRRPYVQMGGIPDSLKPMLAKGDLKVTHCGPFPNSPQECSLDARQVNGSAGCKVLYAPPFYLVHTPGLFEWHEQQNQKNASNQQTTAQRPSLPGQQNPTNTPAGAPGADGNKQATEQQQRTQRRSRENSR